jgi:8-amino-7-oxononanoate synthase
LQRVDGQDVLSFCSNDYLGLANHPKLKEAAVRAINQFGVGSGASHLVNGHSTLHHTLEEKLAEFTGRDRAVLFSTGYMANLGTIAALVGKGDTVLEDRWNHASLLDGGLQSGARFKRYQHNDVQSLERLLAKTEANRRLIVTDGVFSMDGDIAPLTEIAALAEQYNACLMVDDAHGFGVLGDKGYGTAEVLGLDQHKLPVLMATLGKGAGSFGAFVAGSNELIETLIQLARPYIYTTALPPAVAATTIASLDVIAEEAWRRDHLKSLIGYFKTEAALANIELMPSDTPIQPIVVGDAQKALDISAALQDQGVMVTAIRPPTVPEGTSRLRVTFSAEHTFEHLDKLLEALKKAME